MHRGDLQPLRHMSFYTYSRWVRRVPKQAAHEQDNRFFEFSSHYVHHTNYVQELRVSPIVVQLEGLSLPTCCAKPERNAAIKLCLFKPFTPCEGISQHTDNKKKQKLCTADKLHTRKLWRCHGDGGRTRPFCMQWRIHASRTKILCKRAEERRMAACSVPTIHDTWARRVWYPSLDQQLIRQSSHIRHWICFKRASGPHLPPRA